MNKKILIGHVSQETSFEQNNYPYGNLKCLRRVWVETKKGHGKRFVFQTCNPKNGKWNAPKKGTYSSLIVLYLDLETDHVEYSEISGYDSLEKIEAFEQEYSEGLKDNYSQMSLRYLKAAHRAMSKVTVEVTVHKQGDEPGQTLKEQSEFLHKLTLIELAKDKK